MKSTILVVDDSSTVRKFISTSLQADGYAVITAQDGMEALEIMPRFRVDLVITDLNMPDMDGIEFLRTIRATEQYKHLPAIILSSMTDPASKATGALAGAQAFLEKPFSPERVQEQVRQLLLMASAAYAEAAQR